MWKRAGLVLGAVAASFIVTGAGTYQPTTRAPENGAAAQAVEALTHDADDPLAALPSDFADVMGYEPSVVTDAGGARAIKPGGNCSSPVGFLDLSLYDLECKTHDLGYDLLRYAAASGGELGPWARQAIDDEFTAAVDARADVLGGASAQTKAWLADAGVRFNSWRQGQGVPSGENGWPYAVAGLLISAALVGPPIASRVRNRGKNLDPATRGMRAADRVEWPRDEANGRARRRARVNAHDHGQAGAVQPAMRTTAVAK